jgi:membrane protease YdiL (CAAX protease family)
MFMLVEHNDGHRETGTATKSGRKENTLEVCVFLFLIVPSLALSFVGTGQGNIDFPIVALATILRDLALVSLVLFFIWRNAEPVQRIGWTLKNGWRESALGAALFVPFFFAGSALESILRGAGFSAPSKPLPNFLTATDIGGLVLALVLVIVVAIAEETIFRGYLILRFKVVFANPSGALFLSAFVFSLGHGYEGSAGVVTVGFMGLIFGLVYLWRQSLVAPMVMHFLQDFIGIVLIPLMKLG